MQLFINECCIAGTLATDEVGRRNTQKRHRASRQRAGGRPWQCKVQGREPLCRTPRLVKPDQVAHAGSNAAAQRRAAGVDRHPRVSRSSVAGAGAWKAVEQAREAATVEAAGSVVSSVGGV